jgi:hypothetical protein
MSIERLGQACVAISVLILASSVQIAAAGNIIQNSSFEVPKVPRGSYARFPTGSTLGTCGLASARAVDHALRCRIVPSARRPAGRPPMGVSGRGGPPSSVRSSGSLADTRAAGRAPTKSIQ